MATSFAEMDPPKLSSAMRIKILTVDTSEALRDLRIKGFYRKICIFLVFCINYLRTHKLTFLAVQYVEIFFLCP